MIETFVKYLMRVSSLCSSPVDFCEGNSHSGLYQNVISIVTPNLEDLISERCEYMPMFKSVNLISKTVISCDSENLNVKWYQDVQLELLQRHIFHSDQMRNVQENEY